MSKARAGDGTKHIFVRQYVESKIRSGDLKPGDRLPTESTLMRDLEVSRTPVRQALIELARDGWILK